MTTHFRLPFLIVAIASLIVGMATGLNRMGWDLNLVAVSLHHGSIMVGAFLGTLISLEKIIPLKRKMLFVIPALSGSSVLAFFAGIPLLSYAVLLVASAGLSGVFLYYFVRERNKVYLLMLIGSGLWLTGNLMLAAENSYRSAFPCWLGFVLLVITSERLEMTRFLPVTERRKILLLVALCAYVIGLLLPFHAVGRWICGFSLIGVSVWLLQNDIIGISIRKAGLFKFIAIALLSGYVSLMLTGIFMMAFTDQILAFDATVHTFFLGFAFSMIFAHGPVILPGVLGLSARPWHRILYLWLLLLHASWIMRFCADIFLDFELRKVSGLLSVFCILAYFASVATLTIKRTRRHAQIL